MATTRMLRMSNPVSGFCPSSSDTTSLSYCSIDCSSLCTLPKYNNYYSRMSCISKQGFNNGEGRPPGGVSERHPPAAKAFLVPTSATCQKAVEDKGLVLSSLANLVLNLVLQSIKIITKRRPWKFYIQMYVEKVIIDCRFLTLFAVAGSLLASVLCFVEGCFLIVESYLQYFHALAQRVDHGHIMQHLIEAIDMFLVGTAMLTFGISLYVMFVGSQAQSKLHASSSIQFSYLKGLPSRFGVHSVMQAKSKIGHAVLMLLQVGVLEKVKNITLVSGLDLACFAAAVFVSSATTFLLSRLTQAAPTTAQ